MSSDHTRDPDDSVDRQLRLFQKSITEGYAAHPELSTLSLTEARDIAERVRHAWNRGGPEMVSIRNLRVAPLDTRLRMLRPSSSATLPALVYLHGGGWTMFSIDTHDRLMREYAARAGVVVVGIDYRRAPEAKYPQALREVVRVIEWLRDNGSIHGIDTSRLAIGGDSAGANLALASQLRLRDLGDDLLQAMLLNYGAYSDAPSESTRRYDGPSYMLQNEEMSWFWSNYLRNDADRREPGAMPLLADPRGLPPACMVIAGCDILADGNRAMATALRDAGVRVQERIYPHATHSFLEAMSVSEVARQALDDSADWLRQELAG